MCFQVRREAFLSSSVLSLPTFGECHLLSESRGLSPFASCHQVLATLPNCNPSQAISFLLTLGKATIIFCLDDQSHLSLVPHFSSSSPRQFALYGLRSIFFKKGDLFPTTSLFKTCQQGPITLRITFRLLTVAPQSPQPEFALLLPLSDPTHWPCLAPQNNKLPDKHAASPLPAPSPNSSHSTDLEGFLWPCAHPN